MKQAKIQTSDIWNLFVHQNDGWHKVGCTRKDLHNTLATDSKCLDNLDASTTLTFLQSKEDIDSEFFLSIQGRRRFQVDPSFLG